ncbi:hypothetical protein CO608_07840 [Lysobacteraceae bacterium NML08-0793]|nr:hypothetical protein CO608_07840 [Xanthomonadaceae bacterium NML08-0793]
MKAFGYILMLLVVLMTAVFAIPLYASGKVLGTFIVLGIALALCFGVYLAYGPWHARYLEASERAMYVFICVVFLLTNLYQLYRAVETVFTQQCKLWDETGRGALYGKLINASCKHFGIYAYAALHLLIGIVGLWFVWMIWKSPLFRSKLKRSATQTRSALGAQVERNRFADVPVSSATCRHNTHRKPPRGGSDET